jgi:hypothetical protein
VNQAAVGGSVQTSASVNAGNPQAAKIALSGAAVAVRIPQAFQHRLVSPPEQAVASAKLAFGHLQYFFMVPAAVWAGLYTSHYSLSCEPLDAGRFSFLLHASSSRSKNWMWIISNTEIFYFLLFIYGARRPTRLTIPRPFTGTISLNSCLVRFEVRRRKWLLPPFGPYQHACSSQAKTLGGRLVGFDLVLTGRLLAWHGKTPLTQNSAELFHPRMIGHSILL